MTHSSSDQTGFTLVEMVLSLGITAVLLTMLGQVSRSSERLMSTTLTLGRVEEAANNAATLASSEIRWSRPDTLLITQENGSDRVDLVVAQDVDGTDPVWSGPITYRYELSSLDENGNGALDEGNLVRIQGGQRRLLCRNVSFGGMTVTRDGNNVVFGLDVFGLTKDGEILERTVRISTTLVNQGSF